MDRLVGDWELVSWTASVGGSVSAPFGGDVVGRLSYTPGGRMWAILQRRDRAPLGTGTFAAGDEAQRAAASRNFLSYSGRYTLSEDETVVVHHVDAALFPDWIGADQVRHVEWEGDDLVLSSPVETTAGGREVVNRLHWRRSDA